MVTTMSIKEIVEAEKSNTSKIYLYREGLFFRAYEVSAFALCSFVHPFKVIKRQLKVLNGEEVAYVGFPASSEEKYLSGRNIIESDDAHKVIGLVEPIDLNAFAEWKQGVELKESAPANCSVPEVMGHCEGNGVLEKLRAFNLANSTPMQCMMFIAQLQEILKGLK